MPSLPALKIAVMNDLHVGGPAGGGFQNPFLTTDATRLIHPTVKAINRTDVDLVLIPGDLTHDATPEQLAQVDSCLKLLDAPFLACKGNHDRETPEAAARFDAVFGNHAPPGVTCGPDIGLPEDLAILILEASWREDGKPYASDNPPLAVVDNGIIDTALSCLERSRPGLLLVVCHYPLVSQSAYALANDGQYAGHLSGGDDLLQRLTGLAGQVVCFTGHNHFHHIMQGDRWLQCATGALAEYPAEYRLVSVEDSGVSISTCSAAGEVVERAPAPANPWVAGRPEDREFIWRSG